MTETFRSDALIAIHETALDLHKAGVMDGATMREITLLTSSSVPPRRAKAGRKPQKTNN